MWLRGTDALWIAASDVPVAPHNWLDAIGFADLGNISGYGIGVMCFLAVITGRLTTRAHYKDVVEQRDKYEAAFFKQQEANLLKDQQNVTLLETAHAMKQFMESFPKAIGVEEGEGR